MSREFGLLDNSNPKGGGGGYYEEASFKSPYDISNHWSAQKEASCGRDHPTLLKKITEKYRATSVQQSTNVFNL